MHTEYIEISLVVMQVAIRILVADKKSEFGRIL
jgi:hypothetical protein